MCVCVQIVWEENEKVLIPTVVYHKYEKLLHLNVWLICFVYDIVKGNLYYVLTCTKFLYFNMFVYMAQNTWEEDLRNLLKLSNLFRIINIVQKSRKDKSRYVRQNKTTLMFAIIKRFNFCYD